MNTNRMLPSISNLIDATSSNSPPPKLLIKLSDPPPPVVNFSPASPTSSMPSTPPHSLKSPRYLSLDQSPRYSSISPILSPIDSPSYGVQHLSLSGSNHLPPLQGDDPPQRLRLPSPQLPASPISPKSLFSKPSWNSTTTPPSTIQNPPIRQRTMSENNELFQHNNNNNNHHHHNNNSHHFHSASASPPSHHLTVPQRQRSVSTSSAVEPAPNTQIVFDSSGQPVLKRRRGRPPTMRDANSFDGGWTFLAPTVWDVHTSDEQKEREIQADSKERSMAIANTLDSHLQSSQVNDNLMNDSMAAFTNSNMDTILQMPRKKRGRKPKTHIAGNSCFVWKDLTSTRSSTNSKK